MIAEAIQRVRDIADQARKPLVIPIPGSPKHVVHYADADGQLQTLPVAPPLRDLRVHRLDDLIELGRTPIAGIASGGVLCVYTENYVQLVLDQTDGRERVTLPLEWTDEVQFFEARTNEPVIGVPELREALEVLLRPTYRDAKLIEQVSSLVVQQRGQGNISVGSGRESMGKSIEQEAAGGGAGLPDPYQEFMVRVYANPDLNIRQSLQCILKPVLQTMRWHLEPLADSWIDLHALTLEHIRQTLLKGFKDTPVRVVQGAFGSAS